MRDNGNIGPALGSEAVDAQFWASICDDEEWLRTEFDGIVCEPAKHRTSPPPATGIAVNQERPDRSARQTDHTGHSPRWMSRRRPGRTTGHQRSPPSPMARPTPSGTTHGNDNQNTARW